MARIKTSTRKRMRPSTFALPSKRKYPIPDAAHGRAALRMVAAHGTPSEKKRVRAAVHRKFPSIGKRK